MKDRVLRWAARHLPKRIYWAVIGSRSKRLPSYPFDAKDVPGDYVLRGDSLWVPHP